MYTEAHRLEVTARERCQVLFLRAAADHPRIRLEASLRDDVLSRCPQVGLTNLQSLNDEVLSVIDRLIREWAIGRHLAHEWVVMHARRTVLGWLFGNPNFRAFESGPEVSPPRFQPGLRLPGEDDRAYRRRQVQQFKQHFDEYLASMQKSWNDVLPDRGGRASHYRWAVERICLGWTWDHIADEHAKHATTLSPTAVRQAVVPILDKVGLPKTKPNTGQK
jgi:hypothetical protein